MNQKHTISPVFDADSRVLILGSFPSVKSREQGFFYGHSQNRFWRVLAEVLGGTVPATVDEKKKFLLSYRVALWDVIASCDITGSADSSIKNVVPNNLGIIFQIADIQQIFVNGRTAERLYNKYLYERFLRDAICLPSTSPANAAYSLPRLCAEWEQIKRCLPNSIEGQKSSNTE